MARTPWDLATPVALFIFNRPETTRQVFEVVRAARPRCLLVVADGPRAERPGEEERCRAARAILTDVDWDCRILTNFAADNMGCKLRIASGLNWVFQQTDEAIILEDDCLPHPTFFRFCAELLERYRHEPCIAQISGNNFQFGRSRPAFSYYFSRYNHIWGWASWRRAWEGYDSSMADWPALRDRGFLEGRLSGKKELAYWTDVFNKVHAGEIDTWDAQWTFSCWKNNRLTVLPSINLVSNIGFGPGATHTPVPNRYAMMPTLPMHFPLQHPSVIVADDDADTYTGKTAYRAYSPMARLVAAIRGDIPLQLPKSLTERMHHLRSVLARRAL